MGVPAFLLSHNDAKPSGTKHSTGGNIILRSVKTNALPENRLKRGNKAQPPPRRSPASPTPD